MAQAQPGRADQSGGHVGKATGQYRALLCMVAGNGKSKM
jgi:hypothetical protein